MTSAAFDEILRRLVAAGAKFVVIGGLALGARGVVRATKGIDIVQGLEGVPSFDELRSRASAAEVLGVNVAVCSVEDLRAIKQAAGRGQDLVDLENLDAAEG
jgi:predicted nucleotidyltransferase